jgi:predicted kinase
VVSLLHQAAQHQLQVDPGGVIVLERTCTRSYQLDDVRRLAAATGQPLAVIWCWCPDQVAKTRLDADLLDRRHPAANRTFELYRRLQQTAEPLTGTVLRLRTDQDPHTVLTQAVAYVDRLDTPAEAAAR